MFPKKILFLSLLVVTASCSSFSDDDDKELNKPVVPAEKLYKDARLKMNDGKYKDAIKDFEEVERQHPASPFAVHSQIMSGYASYEIEDYDTAVATLERFVRLYPSNESTPYAYYLIALCYYEQISDVGRDQKITGHAMDALQEVVNRFPDTDYARDAKIKLDLTQDHLAGKEMQVGRYYLKKADTLAAINRFKFVVDNYQTTSHTPEALHRLVEAYLKLGIIDEAKKYAAVLGYNFPNSLWYRDSYKLMNGVAPKQASSQPEEKITDKDTQKPAEKSSSWLESVNPF